jgi:capsular exopolysaccharide synthesis family protein
LITDIGRYAARAEAFRTLRTNLKFVRPDSPPQVIMVGSALPVEGKTTSAINLAISMMHNGSKTLIIEADLRRPEVPKYLGIEKSKDKMGLSELLIEGKEFTPELLQSAISQHLDGDLDFMLSGKVPPNPAELLGSRVFDELLVALRKSYDFIIIDAPPLLPVTDGAIISTRCDGVILIVHAGTTKKPQLHGAVDALNSVGSPLLGAVLNQIPESSLEYEYGYRYGYPRYYGNNYGYSPGSEKPEANLYSPGPEDMARIEREDQRKRSTGQRFKEELQRQGEGKNQ